MKKNLLTKIMLVLALAFTCGQGQAQELLAYNDVEETTSNVVTTDDDITDLLGKVKGIESVYVSKTMLAFAKTYMPGNMKKDALSKLEGIYVFDADNKKTRDELCRVADNELRKPKYELMMRSDDDDESMRIYQCKLSKSLNEFILYTFEADEAEVIVFKGNISAEDLEGIY